MKSFIYLCWIRTRLCFVCVMKFSGFSKKIDRIWFLLMISILMTYRKKENLKSYLSIIILYVQSWMKRSWRLSTIIKSKKIRLSWKSNDSSKRFIHHSIHYSSSKVKIEPVGSCCTLIGEKLLASNRFQISNEIAYLLTGKRMGNKGKKNNKKKDKEKFYLWFIRRSYSIRHSQFLTERW